MKCAVGLHRGIIMLAVLGLLGCDNDDDGVSACQLEPDPGPCNAAFIKYYFDKEEQKCKEFVWGGCNGVVPFHTMEACRECEGN